MADNEVAEYFKSTIAKDFLDLFAGERIGRGMSRAVYEHGQDSSLVVKIEISAQRFQNIQEWENWRTWREDKRVARWLAPCVDISPCGMVLLQKRTRPLEQSELPDKLPHFLTDTKIENFGMLDGKVVCHDYALLISGISHRQRKARWW